MATISKAKPGKDRTGPQVNGLYQEYGIAGYGIYSDWDYNNETRTYGVNAASRLSWARKLVMMKRDPTIALLRQLYVAAVEGAGYTVGRR